MDPHGIIPARAGFTLPFPISLSLITDHPRSRGVYSSLAPSCCAGPGSSPLARGLRPLQRQHHGVCWIIPARAGFTLCRARAVSGVWDHPRSRGVYRLIQAAGHRSLGSSPLARGLRATSAKKVCVARIIPARAGFTAADGDADGVE